MGLLYQQLLRGGQVGGEASLPPVLPMVLYNGERPWTAPTDVGDLVVDVPGGLADYRPRMRYLLLEERAYREPDLAAMRNLVAALFRLENSRDAADVRRVVDALAAWLREPNESGLARAFVDWLREILLPSRMPEAELPRLEDLQEVRTLLAERVKEWTRQWREEGLQKGLQKGREEGRKKGREEGEGELLLRQLEHKFGPLDDEIRRRIDEATSEQLLAWAERILIAKEMDEVFA